MHSRLARTMVALLPASVLLAATLPASAQEDLMEKLRQKTLELQQKKKPAAAAPKPAPKPAEAAAPKPAAPKPVAPKVAKAPTIPKTATPKSPYVALHADRKAKREITVEWNGACAEYAGLLVRLKGVDSDTASATIEAAIGAARAKLARLCPVVSMIDVAVIPAGDTSADKRYTLSATKAWAFEPATGIGDMPPDGIIGFTSSRGLGRLRVEAPGTVTGGYRRESPWESVVIGTAAPGYDAVAPSKIDRWMVEGYWYELGTPKEKCDRPRSGYAYWGSFQLQVPASDTLEGAPGMMRPCTDIAESGDMLPWHVVFVPGHGEKPNPFNALPAASAKPDEPAAGATGAATESPAEAPAAPSVETGR